jgi:butyrate kinase
VSLWILSINPGSVSTKVALYEDERECFRSNLLFSEEERKRSDRIVDQLPLREKEVKRELQERQVDLSRLSAVVGRGGMLPPVQAGGYRVNQEMIDLLMSDRLIDHASNLGALLAARIAAPLGIPAYVYDAVSSDEFESVARITGFPEILRYSFSHALNSKAMGRAYAAARGTTYEKLRLLVAHLGGGISISAHQHGRIIDAVSDDAGPFSPERSGCLPLNYIIDLCYSGRFTKAEMTRRIRGDGGLKAHLGTSDCQEVERMIDDGNEYAREVYEAMAYQVAKGIGSICTVFDGPIDAIILTGGIAHSERLTGQISHLVNFLAPVVVMPGENEMEALTLGTLRILRGQEQAREFSVEHLVLSANRGQ